MACKSPVDRYSQIFRKTSRSTCSLFSRTGIHFLNEGNSISRDDYRLNSYPFFAFDFIPHLFADCARHWNFVKHGSLDLRLEVRFEKVLFVTINCIIYVEFDNVLEILPVTVDFFG